MELETAIRERRSCRAYKPDPVPDNLIRECVEAARLAPSACNKQPWRFYAVSAPDLRKQLCEEALLPGIKMPWLEQAPVIMVLCMKKKLATHFLAPLLSGIHYEYIDLGIAGEHFVLAAEERGLGTCWVGWIKAARAKKILDLPFDVTPVSFLSVGYPAELRDHTGRLPLEEILTFLR